MLATSTPVGLATDSATKVATTSPSSGRKSSEESAWDIAVDRYLKRLPVELRSAFKAPADADDCLRILHAAQARNRKFDKLVSVLQPLVEPLKRFENSIDVLVQTWQTVASPIWGPVRAIVTIASGRLSTLNTIVVLLERLVQPLRRFHNYEELFQQNASLRHAIGALYCDLLEFCTRLAVHHVKSPLRKTFGSFDKDVAEISDKIRHHWTEVDVVANAANIVEAKEARKKEEEQRRDDFRRDVSRWLAPASVEDDLDRFSSTCADGSCQWIWDAEELQALRQSDKAATVRISAFPGGGKSVAASQLVRMLQAEERFPVLYFFCRGTDAEKSFTTLIARTLAWQLLQTDDTLYDRLAPIYNRSGRQTADSEVVSFTLFDTVFRETKHHDIYVVIDALDECYDASRLITLLSSAQHSVHARLKVIITSRDDPVLSNSLYQSTPNLQLRRNEVPLRSYIENGVAELRLPLSQSERNDIRHMIEQSSVGGLWLFAKLMLEQLETASSMHEIRQQIESVPDGLAQLYTSILSQREKGLSKAHLQMAQHLFLWLRTTDYIPTEEWRAHGDRGLNDDVLQLVLQYATKSESEIFDLMDLVQRLGSPLLTTRLLHEDHVVLFINGKAVQCTSFVAQTFHQTADQYLVWCADAATTQVPHCLQPRRLAALHRGACAAWYFGESSHFDHVLHHLQERPRSEVDDCYLEMACALWQALSLDCLPRGLSEDELVDIEELVGAITSFLTFDGCLRFVEASLILQFSGQSSLLQNQILPCDDAALTPTRSRSKPPRLQPLVDCAESFKSDLRSCLTAFPATSAVAFGGQEVDQSSDSTGLRARKIHNLARKYRYLSLSPGACSINGFLLGPTIQSSSSPRKR